ncbi:hypothetical protein H2199_002930 [Coniosporium tulheliwenetii]|uniref:Uncharacterized protein n=1 Tax=Coniosporium tulheliwenetii TaxID=3383036 RepID=A0ACC2ZDR7_9PEZI|nr:hypothetical protein H2199_002930 [Cladosporium sp. JES 115]
MLEYFNYKRWKKENPAEAQEHLKNPVLNEDDEKLLQRITSQGDPPPALPDRSTVILDDGKKAEGQEAQEAMKEGADNVPLPNPPAPEGSSDDKPGEEGKPSEESKASGETKPSEEDNPSGADKGAEESKPSEEEKKKQGYWSYIPAMPTMPTMPAMPAIPSYHFKHKDKEQTADDLKDAAEDVKKGEGVDLKEDGKVDKKEAKKEDQDLGSILDRLNLAAVNNRVFSFSKESQELMEKFKQVLMDIVNGAPTAYDDLEKLLRDSDGQLQKMYGNLPPFLKTLIKSLPAKMTGTLGPELLAAASEKRGFDAKAAAAATESDTEEGDKKKVKKSRVPPLKKLVSQQGAVASMLRSILNFLQLRFPMFITGTNVLMSLAVFLLLFVFWYCHKRGKEMRLEKERQGLAETESDAEKSAEASDLEDSEVLEKPREESEEDAEAPIKLHDDPAVDEKPSSSVADMPSVLDLPEPADVALPKKDEDKAQKEAPIEAEK